MIPMEAELRVFALAFLSLTLLPVTSAQAAPVATKAMRTELAANSAIELVRQGCGPGWHRARWRDRYGYWHLGRCIPY